MIRVLVMIAVAGFLVSVATLSAAVAIGGPDIISDAAWHGWRGGHFGWSDDSHFGWGATRDDDDVRHSDADTTREIAWTGGDNLEVDVPADVTYTQSPGPGKLVVTGPQREIDALRLDGGRLYGAHRRRWRDVTIAMTAPAVTRFEVTGSGRLDIRDYGQERLSLDLPGDATVTAAGQTKSLALSVEGSGDTDLSQLKLADASVDVAGSGVAKLAPTGAANINISGSGNVILLTRPAKLESNVSGSGSIHQGEGGAPASPAPPAKHPRRKST
jgi:hypothetical protein